MNKFTGLAKKEEGMESIYWLLLFMVLLGIEILTLGLTTIWFAGGALAAFAAALLNVEFVFQILIFAAVSLVLLFFTRPLATKYLNRKTVRTNVESLEGRHAIVIEAIDNLQAKGSVTIDGVVWSARSAADEEIIPEGVLVKILRISGVKLIVEKFQEEKI